MIDPHTCIIQSYVTYVEASVHLIKNADPLQSPREELPFVVVLGRDNTRVLHGLKNILDGLLMDGLTDLDSKLSKMNAAVSRSFVALIENKIFRRFSCRCT